MSTAPDSCCQGVHKACSYTFEKGEARNQTTRPWCKGSCKAAAVVKLNIYLMPRQRLNAIVECSRYIKKEAGTKAYCLTYPRRAPLEIAAEVAARQISGLAQGREVVAVVHSMGGIILRYIMKLPQQGK